MKKVVSIAFKIAAILSMALIAIMTILAVLTPVLVPIEEIEEELEPCFENERNTRFKYAEDRYKRVK